MLRLIPLAILIIDIIVILDIVRRSMDTERKVLWILAVVFLPVLGPIAYYLMRR